jgi:hypothetical protein
MKRYRSILLLMLTLLFANLARAQCRDDEVLVGEDRDNYYCKKVSFQRGADSTGLIRSERETVQSILRHLPNGTPKKWVLENVNFDRGSRGSTDFAAGVRPGTVRLYDPFFAARAGAQYQENILIFEIGKAVWFGKVNPGPREQSTRRQERFSNIVQKHAAVVGALGYASLRGEDLSALTDTDARGDLQSQFALAFRVVLLGLDLPAGNPDSTFYSDAQWQTIRRSWPAARKELEHYVEETFTN